ncbi:hypothetical protein DID75_01915 [Candidatus Marinamargulisbacteria bacterium SCGC AG-410-N11]|nr:hypothetical protein DID75_01915 [Candidatus Marinamargulisbacteria bacterium SCGC AG-410-N11]
MMSVGGFTIIGIVDILFYLVDLAILSGVQFSTIIRLLIYKLPAIMVLFFPMAVLFATMLLLVRMAKDNELTILRASGVHTFRILLPLLFIILISSGISFIINEDIVPWTNNVSEKLIRKEIQKKPPPNIVENVVFKGSSNRFFYIKKVFSKEAKMENLLIFEETRYFPRLTTAKNASWNGHSWTLNNGYIQEINKDGILEFLDSFEELKIHVDQNIRTYLNRQKSAKEMDSQELKKRIDTLNKGGISTRTLKVEYYMKSSLPGACFIFGFLGIAFCLSFVRSGKDWWGVILSICFAVLSVGFYFFLLSLSRAFAKDPSFNIFGYPFYPFLGAWLPNFIYGFIASLVISYQCKYK